MQMWLRDVEEPVPAELNNDSLIENLGALNVNIDNSDIEEWVAAAGPK